MLNQAEKQALIDSSILNSKLSADTKDDLLKYIKAQYKLIKDIKEELLSDNQLETRLEEINTKTKYYYFSFQSSFKDSSTIKSDVTDKHPFEAIKQMQRNSEGLAITLILFQEINEDEYNLFLED
jgi:hypothetical protein